jgi:hypothetical protein
MERFCFIGIFLRKNVDGVILIVEWLRRDVDVAVDVDVVLNHIDMRIHAHEKHLS